MRLLEYVRRRLDGGRRQSRIETKKGVIITGRITGVDRQMNLTIEDARIGERVLPVYRVEGRHLRSFYL